MLELITNTDARTRMVDVVIRIEKPYATRPPLVAGLFVTVEIQGRTLENAAVIPREALRDDNTVWVVDNTGQLTFRNVEVARLSTTSAILKSGIANELLFYNWFGLAPSVVFFLMVFAWSSIWAVTGILERPLARLGRLLVMAVYESTIPTI